MELRNKVDSLSYELEKNLRENRDKLPANLISEAESAVKDAKSAMDTSDKDRLQQAINNLTRVSHQIAQILYQQAASRSAQTGSQGSSSSKDGSSKEEVIDAEFEDMGKQ